MSPAKDPNDLDRARKGYDSYLRFTGMGIQMMAIILAGAFGGHWIDGWTGWKYPVFTIVLSLLGITGAMVFLFKETGRR